MLELALIENLQRENLSPLEEAAGYMRLKAEFKMKQGDIAKRVGQIPRGRSQQHAPSGPAAGRPGHAGQFLHQRGACQGTSFPEEIDPADPHLAATS